MYDNCLVRGVLLKRFFYFVYLFSCCRTCLSTIQQKGSRPRLLLIIPTLMTLTSLNSKNDIKMKLNRVLFKCDIDIHLMYDNVKLVIFLVIYLQFYMTLLNCVNVGLYKDYPGFQYNC